MRTPLPGGQRIGVIRIEGAIMGGRGAGGLFGSGAGSDDILAQIDRARRDSSIKAVVLRINSPGGSAAASEEIYKEVMRLRERHKPVIASMGDMAASGGYYVAAAADQIMADGSTLTGSIGVIMQMENLQGLMGKLGISSNTIKSGKFKDIGSYSRPMSAEERQLLQALINDTYEQFVSAVIAGRKKMDPAMVRRLADGRIFTGRQALKHKMVDHLGNYQDAIRLAAKSAGITGTPTVVEMRRHGFLDMLSDTSTEGHMGLPSSGEEQRLARLLRRLLADEAAGRLKVE